MNQYVRVSGADSMPDVNSVSRGSIVTDFVSAISEHRLMSDYLGVGAALAFAGFGALVLGANSHYGAAMTIVGLVMLSGTAFQVTAGRLTLILSTRRLAEAASLQSALAALGIVLGILWWWVLFLLAAVAGVSLVALGVSVRLMRQSPYPADARQLLGRAASLFRVLAFPDIVLVLGSAAVVMIVGPREWNMSPLAAVLLFAVPFAIGLVGVAVAVIGRPGTPKWFATELPPAGARLATKRELVAQRALDLPVTIASFCAMTFFFGTFFVGVMALFELLVLGAAVELAKLERTGDTKILSDPFTPVVGLRRDARKAIYAEMSRQEYEQQRRSMPPRWSQTELDV